ncbi:hypothetical protein RR46_01900 [Papilio xuthus]|uniref:Uncharacterized protein n=1 Tax=Papilio xuthus TaxID=66420 RepID=A0A194QHM0_PAPXU|nr:hypothetical protein RR46_01900 [Papilio xuthus]
MSHFTGRVALARDAATPCATRSCSAAGPGHWRTAPRAPRTLRAHTAPRSPALHLAPALSPYETPTIASRSPR